MMTPATGQHPMDNNNWTLSGFITALATMAGGWTVNEWLSVGGFFLMLFTGYMQWRRDQREAEYHDWKRKNLLKQVRGDDA